jgi:hypothetical protein
MMIELWWKVFLGGLIIAGVLKLLGNSANFALLFFLSSIGVLLLFVVAMAVSNFLSERKKSE